MENQNPQVFTMDPLPAQAPTTPTAEVQASQPQPQAQPQSQTPVTPTTPNPIYPSPSPTNAWNPPTPPAPSTPMINPMAAYESSKAGMLSLGMGIAAFLIVPLLVFVPKLIGAQPLYYLWVTIVIGLGVGGILFGKIALEAQKVDFKALVGVILSVTMILMATLSLAYYVKLQMTIRSFSSYSSSYDLDN